MDWKKVYTAIQFNQEAWLNPHNEMNAKLRTEAKNDFEKDVFSLMNNCFLKDNEKCKKA